MSASARSRMLAPDSARSVHGDSSATAFGASPPSRTSLSASASARPPPAESPARASAPPCSAKPCQAATESSSAAGKAMLGGQPVFRQEGRDPRPLRDVAGEMPVRVGGAGDEGAAVQVEELGAGPRVRRVAPPARHAADDARLARYLGRRRDALHDLHERRAKCGPRHLAPVRQDHCPHGSEGPRVVRRERMRGHAEVPSRRIGSWPSSPASLSFARAIGRDVNSDDRLSRHRLPRASTLAPIMRHSGVRTTSPRRIACHPCAPPARARRRRCPAPPTRPAPHARRAAVSHARRCGRRPR